MAEGTPVAVTLVTDALVVVFAVAFAAVLAGALLATFTGACTAVLAGALAEALAGTDVFAGTLRLAAEVAFFTAMIQPFKVAD